MYPYKKVLVGLDMSVKDDEVIRYTAFARKFFKYSDIYFMHVTPEHDLPEEIREQYPELNHTTDEQLRDVVRAKVQEHLSFCLSPVCTPRTGRRL